MKPLEKIVGSSSIRFGSFKKLIYYTKIKIQEGNMPLIAIELPEWSKFIAFFVRHMQKNPNKTYRPLPAGYLYDCSLPDGFFTPNGEGSQHIRNYPIDIGKQDFKQDRVYVIEPDTKLWEYIGIQIGLGRIPAHEFWRQENPELATPAEPLPK